MFSVHRNNGDGTFAPPTFYTVGGDPRSILLEDVDHDLDLDVIVSNSLGGQLLVYDNSGDGVFVLSDGPYEFAPDFRPLYMAAGDLDEDGSIDLAVSSGYGSVCVLWNRSDGSFEYGPCYDLLPDGFLYGIVALNLDGDDLLDLAVLAIPFEATTHTVLNDDAGVFVLRNGADRGFDSIAWYDIPSWPGSELVGADVDQDGDVDLAGINSANARPDAYGMWVLLNDSLGRFGEANVFEAGSYPSDLQFGDIDGDGDLDAVIPDRKSPWIDPPHSTTILLNQGDGEHWTSLTEDVGFLPEAAVLVDLDGERSLDVVVANFSGYGYTPTLSILWNLCNRLAQVDFDANGVVDVRDHAYFTDCLTGPGFSSCQTACGMTDLDGNGQVDLSDWGRFCLIHSLTR